MLETSLQLDLIGALAFEQSREELLTKINQEWQESRIYRLPKYDFPKPTKVCNVAKLAFWSFQAVGRDCTYTVKTPTLPDNQFVAFISSSIGDNPEELAYITQALDFGACSLEFWDCGAPCAAAWTHFDGEVARQLELWQEQINRRESIIWLNKPKGFSARACTLHQNTLSHINTDNDFVQHKGLDMLALQKQGVMALLMCYPPKGSMWFTDAVIVTCEEVLS